MTGNRKMIYISAPMRGVPDYNEPLFTEFDELFTGHGFQVINPIKVTAEIEEMSRRIDPTCRLPLSPRHYFYVELPLICRGVNCLLVLQKPWNDSKGCRAEVATAVACDIPVFVNISDGYWEQYGSVGWNIFSTSELIDFMRRLK